MSKSLLRLGPDQLDINSAARVSAGRVVNSRFLSTGDIANGEGVSAAF
jgi:hypothetical protein